LKRYLKSRKPLCDDNCWHYSSFGGEEGCGQHHGGWGGWPEPIKPGERCLHPEDRDVSEPIYVGSFLGFCAALEGAVIEGGPHDNTQVAGILTNSKYPSR